MEKNIITTLTVKICGTIETPPATNRELFRQSVIDTILFVLKTQDVSVEFIGYKPDNAGVHHLNGVTTEFEDCVFVSMNVNSAALNPLDEKKSKDDLIQTFVEVFENKTHRHLEIDSTIIKKGKRQRIIEMSSDWKYYLKQG